MPHAEYKYPTGSHHQAHDEWRIWQQTEQQSVEKETVFESSNNEFHPAKKGALRPWGIDE